MSRERRRGMIMEGLIMPTKIRKRGCSSSSSSSSRIHNHRLNKRAGKTRAGLLIGLGGSRSNTPAPTWRTTPLRGGVDSPKHSQSGRSTQPVSARRLAATLWEMNEMPSPKLSESNLEVTKKKSGSKMVFKREKMQAGWRLHSSSGYLPPHLSDPSHSPTVSEGMDRSMQGSRQRTPSISQKLRSAEQNAAVFNSISKASQMEVETRSHVPTLSGSVSGGRNRLRDISNALTTSKELLKIINRLWARADQPSSSMSVISALHAELERARLQVNHLVKEQHPDKSDVNYLLKCFAEEKASWKAKEQRAVEEAIESIAGELEVERKLRRRLERLNAKLGKELADLNSSFMKAVKDLESEKRAREITEQVCSELERNIDDVQKIKNEPVEVHELVDDEKRRPDEKNSAISKLRKQLEVFLGTKRDKDEKRGMHFNESNFIPEGDGQEDEDAVENRDDSEESDVHSIQSNVKHNKKSHRWGYPVDEIKGRNSISGQVSRRSTSVVDGLERGRVQELEVLRRMDLKDRVLSSSRLSSGRQDQHWRDALGKLQVNEMGIQGTTSKSRLGRSKR